MPLILECLGLSVEILPFKDAYESRLSNLILPSRSMFHLNDTFLVAKNVYWSDGGDLVIIASENLFYILKYNISIRILQLRFLTGVYIT